MECGFAQAFAGKDKPVPCPDLTDVGQLPGDLVQQGGMGLGEVKHGCSGSGGRRIWSTPSQINPAPSGRDGHGRHGRHRRHRRHGSKWVRSDRVGSNPARPVGRGRHRPASDRSIHEPRLADTLGQKQSHPRVFPVQWGSICPRVGSGPGDEPKGQPASRPVKERDSSIQVSIRDTFTRRVSAFRWAIDWATRIAIEAMR